MKVAIVGGGWAGLTAAVAAMKAGHAVTLMEAARTVGGRARALDVTLPDGRTLSLDNGQHIMIGAYTETMAAMRAVGLDPDHTLLRQPLNLQFSDGDGLALPAWPSPLDAVAGIARAKGWSWADKWSLVRASLRWQLQGFRCDAHATVAEVCRSMSPTIMATLIDPLCVSALNTPTERSSGAVFLRVLKDSLFGGRGSSNLLLPRLDMGALYPVAAAQWLQQQGAKVRTGSRVTTLAPAVSAGWTVDGEAFDRVIWATSASHAATALMESARTAPETIANQLTAWAQTSAALQFEAIATVYAYGPKARLPRPMLALRSDADSPAQFAFDRGLLYGEAQSGLLALVVSASQGDREALQTAAIAQMKNQLGLALQPVQTVVEKRATFACTPGLRRPPQQVAPGLLACGDYVEGPYPATLEGAIRSGLSAVRALANG